MGEINKDFTRRFVEGFFQVIVFFLFVIASIIWLSMKTYSPSFVVSPNIGICGDFQNLKPGDELVIDEEIWIVKSKPKNKMIGISQEEESFSRNVSIEKLCERVDTIRIRVEP